MNVLIFCDTSSPLMLDRILMLGNIEGVKIIVGNADGKAHSNGFKLLDGKNDFLFAKKYFFHNKIIRYAASIVATLLIIVKYRPKLIVVHWASRLWQSVILGLFGFRVIVHTMNGDINPLYDGNRRKKKFTSFLLDRAAIITVKSKYGLTILKENFSAKLLDKTHIVSWGVEQKLLDNSNTDVRVMLGLKSDSKLIFCPRSMQPIYYKKEIVSAFFEYLDESDNDVRLVVSVVNAHQNYMDEYKEFISNSRYEKDVIFVNLKHEEMASFLYQADAVISFTKSDGLSQTIMEGLSVGAKIICYDMPDYDDILFHKKNSFLFKDIDGIKNGIKYFADEKQKVKIVNSVTEILDYEIQKQKYIKLCKAIIAGEKN